ncbi:cytidylyltransferase domain-containing protein [Bacillus alkalicellulosilyticus]|uniref:acylneuraminate cytidylyltransferase family protein n=1 Tax=Alkalihalobacterium alkalicellulosilyticum TaxID=1912214 RepID=UPI0009989439|nr:acylneuraminate cytidylyltransferase family protein [Bacillus alkalicellulosilyticus]
MIGGKRILGIIPARGGSKGIPRKNIKDLGGKPLLAWTIEEAKKSKYIDKLILSSEDEEIISIAKKWGCDVPFKRPNELAEDNTPGSEPVVHALQHLPGYDYVVLLQPTSPLRSIEDIDGCIRKCYESNSYSCVTVTTAEKSPYWMYKVNGEGRMSQIIRQDKLESRRQDVPMVYSLNGAVYVAKVKEFLSEKSFITEDTLAYVMSKINSIDIDDQDDFSYVQYLIEKNKWYL